MAVALALQTYEGPCGDALADIDNLSDGLLRDVVRLLRTFWLSEEVRLEAARKIGEVAEKHARLRSPGHLDLVHILSLRIDLEKEGALPN